MLYLCAPCQGVFQWVGGTPSVVAHTEIARMVALVSCIRMLLYSPSCMSVSRVIADDAFTGNDMANAT